MWTALEERVAEDFNYDRKMVTEIRQQFFESEGADVVVHEKEPEGTKAVVEGQTANYNNQKLFDEHLRHIVDFVDESHRQGKGVTLRKVRTSVCKKFGLDISKISQGER